MTDDARARGMEVLRALNVPPGSGPALPEALGQMTVDHVFGEVWARPGLALRDRSLATVTILAALGRDPYLRLHLHGALNVGISPEELEELFLHLAHYAGWPLGIAASRALADVLAERAASGDGDRPSA
jgi:4-carboxymuconolactone decarboxylase